MNKYKIDVNRYFDTRWPYAIYVKGAGWFSKWEHLGSFKTVEEASMALQNYTKFNLPIVFDAYGKQI